MTEAAAAGGAGTATDGRADGPGGGPAGGPERLPPARPRWLVGLLVGLIAIALVAVGGGVAAVTGIGRPYLPGDDSIDVGFARDMIVHHEQAVQMAQVVRDHGSDPALRLLAFDIETQQLAQVGRMRGWLESWGVTEQTDRAHMAWMGAASPMHEHDAAAAGGAVMPGMATTVELTKLRSLSGQPLDVYFLQLMIRHHQGALAMAGYAAEQGRIDYVRGLAGKVVTAQTGEIVTMEQLLRERGGEPLPSP